MQNAISVHATYLVYYLIASQLVDVNQHLPQKLTYLQTAVKTYNDSACRLLVLSGANVNDFNLDPTESVIGTPLHAAAITFSDGRPNFGKAAKIVKTLTEFKADPHLRDSRRRTFFEALVHPNDEISQAIREPLGQEQIEEQKKRFEAQCASFRITRIQHMRDAVSECVKSLCTLYAEDFISAFFIGNNDSIIIPLEKFPVKKTINQVAFVLATLSHFQKMCQQELPTPEVTLEDFQQLYQEYSELK
jgi:hypothetical protein